MATAAEPAAATGRTLDAEQRVVLRGAGWAGYETLADLVGDGHTRLTCDGRDVELMAPSQDHEEFSNLIGRIIEAVTEEFQIPCLGMGSTTWRKRAREKGLEADECYDLASPDRIRGKRGDLDPTVDPPPDLAVEVEISRSALDRMSVYAAPGVPEVWRFDGHALTVYRLRADNTYEAVSESPGLPMLPVSEVVRWVLAAEAMDDHTEWARRFREWVRAELVPRGGGR